jgi:cytochrome P450
MTTASINPFRLDGETALITGGGSGIGLGIARCMVQAGAKVVLVGRREDQLIQACAELGALACYVAHDVTRLDAAGELVAAARERASFEAVRDFAIPLQSRALAILLNVPDAEAAIWIGWGTHVFRDGNGTSKGAALEAYTNALLDRAAAHPGDDLFSALTQATFQGRPLTRQEMLGFCSIVFAGGRDTVINSITGILAHLAHTPADFEFLRADRKRIVGASEEFFRALSPVTHLARKCTRDTTVHGVAVPAGEFVSLCFSSANFDATVFDAPDEVRLDRRPNPHVAFGFGAHLCLGQHLAKMEMRILFEELIPRLKSVSLDGEMKLTKSTFVNGPKTLPIKFEMV